MKDAPLEMATNGKHLHWEVLIPPLSASPIEQNGHASCT